MAVDLETKTTKELEVIIANCQRLNRTGDARCIDARNIVAGRRSGAFDTEKTVATICEHGKQGRFAFAQRHRLSVRLAAERVCSARSIRTIGNGSLHLFA